MPEKKRVYTPVHSYDIQLKIKQLDYSNDLRSVRIVSAISAPYQIITLELSLDPNVLTLGEIFGKDPFKLSIRLIGREYEKIPQEDIRFELQYVTHESPAQPKEQLSEGKTKDRSIVKIITICRKPFRTMMKKIEATKVYFEKTPREIIQDLIKETEAELIYDLDDENTDRINQVTLPPQTLHYTIGYLDDYFGLFKGASNRGFCQYNNKLYIQNLTRKIRKKQEFTIYQLAIDNPSNNEIIKKCSDGKNFYTYGALNNQYTGSTKIAALGRKVHYIVHPKDDLSRTISLDIKETCLNYGLIAKDGDVKLDLNLSDRERYISSHSGNDDSNIFAIASIAREIAGLSTVQIALEKNLPIMKLMKVGETVKLNCGSIEYIPLSNKYILKSSDINFTRTEPDWVSSCIINLMRTNQYI